MAAELKRLAGDETERLEGIDIKTKINNLTQRYRSEKKTVQVFCPSQEMKPGWKFYDRIHKILGSLPSNDCMYSNIPKMCPKKKFRWTNDYTNIAKRCSKKRFRWTNDLEMMLLDIWEDKIANLRRQKRNSHVYAQMAGELKMLSGNETERLKGIDVKTKISNLTQRYRSEKKTVEFLGGKVSEWKIYDRVHNILESLPCKDFSPDRESFQVVVEMVPCGDGNRSEAYNIKNEIEELYLEDQQTEESFQSPSTPASSSACGNTIPRPVRKIRSLKRQAQEDIDEMLLQEIRRSNDLTEQQLKQNQATREAQVKCLTALEAIAMSILECININSNKE